MKKILFTLLVAVACVLTTSAQEVFVKGDKVFHAGLGFGSYLGGTGYSNLIPPVLVSAEYGVTDALLKDGKGYVGVGGYLAYSADELKGTDYKWTHVIFGARGAFHYQFVDNLDTYAGVMLGYDAASFSGNKSLYTSSLGGFTYTSFVGARYYFTDKIAAFGELGYGIAALELGVAIKF